MPNIAEKIHESDLEANPDWINEEVERWLREDVVRLCQARADGLSQCKPFDQAVADMKARFKAKHGI